MRNIVSSSLLANQGTEKTFLVTVFADAVTIELKWGSVGDSRHVWVQLLLGVWNKVCVTYPC